MDVHSSSIRWSYGIGKLMTEFLGGNGNHKFGGFVIKVIIVIALILAAFFIGVTRDWISVTKEGAVSAQRIEQVEKNFSAHVVWAESERDISSVRT